MRVTKNRDTYQLVSSIWPHLSRWLRNIEKIVGEDVLNQAMESALQASKDWHTQNSFGSVKHRNIHILRAFLSELDEQCLALASKSIDKMIPEGVKQAMNKLEGDYNG